MFKGGRDFGIAKTGKKKKHFLKSKFLVSGILFLSDYKISTLKTSQKCFGKFISLI